MPKKILSGSDIVDYIKPRQESLVRSLVSRGIQPRLAIVRTNADPVIDTYLRIKSAYAKDIGAEVEIVTIDTDDALEEVKKLNNRIDVHGIIIQLPLGDTSKTDKLLVSVSPKKDVDGLGDLPDYDPATPTAILWLLSGYNVDLRDKKILVVGQGRLVGAPLARMLRSTGLEINVADDATNDLSSQTLAADIIVSAAGVPGLINSEMVAHGAVVVDAGTASENGKIVGDVADELRTRPDIIITPKLGGVGPLTVAALFDNLLRAASKSSTAL